MTRTEGEPATRLLAVVPAFNEADRVGDVVRRARSAARPPDVVVVDDGSTDGTAEVARAAGASVVVLPFNCGIGASVQAGVAFGLHRDYSIIARFDGDGQHDPRDLERLVEVIDAGDADFVVGSRYIEPGGDRSTPMRRLGGRWFSGLLRLFCGLRITDPTSGLWAANRRAATVVLQEYSSDYPEVDSLVSLRRNGCSIRECPVRMRRRSGGRSSIQGLSALYYMLKVTIALLIGRVRAHPARLEV